MIITFSQINYYKKFNYLNSNEVTQSKGKYLEKYIYAVINPNDKKVNFNTSLVVEPIF